MQKIDLGDGKFAVAREMDDLTRGHVRQVYRLFDDQEQDVSKTSDTMATLVDSATVILIDSWDLDVPVTVEALSNLPLKTYQILEKAVQATVQKVLDLGQAPDPKSGPSSSQPANTASKAGPRRVSPKTGGTD